MRQRQVLLSQPAHHKATWANLSAKRHLDPIPVQSKRPSDSAAKQLVAGLLHRLRARQNPRHSKARHCALDPPSQPSFWRRRPPSAEIPAFPGRTASARQQALRDGSEALHLDPAQVTPARPQARRSAHASARSHSGKPCNASRRRTLLKARLLALLGLSLAFLVVMAFLSSFLHRRIALVIP